MQRQRQGGDVTMALFIAACTFCICIVILGRAS
jgi:hypothetical protein